MPSHSFDITAAPEQVSSTAFTTAPTSPISETVAKLDGMIEQTMRLCKVLDKLGLDTTRLDLDNNNNNNNNKNDNREFTCEFADVTERTLEWVCSSFHPWVDSNGMCLPRHIALKNQYKKDKQDEAQYQNHKKAVNRAKKQRSRKTKSVIKSLRKESRKEKGHQHQIHASVLQDVAAFKHSLDIGCHRKDPKQQAKARRLERAEKKDSFSPLPAEESPEPQQQESSLSEQNPVSEPQPQQEEPQQPEQEVDPEPTPVADEALPHTRAIFHGLYELSELSNLLRHLSEEAW